MERAHEISAYVQNLYNTLTRVQTYKICLLKKELTYVTCQFKNAELWYKLVNTLLYIVISENILNF